MDRLYLRARQDDPHAHDALSPRQFFKEVGVSRQGGFTLFFWDEQVEVFPVERRSREDFSPDPKRREMKMRLFRGFGQRQRKLTYLLECHGR